MAKQELTPLPIFSATIESDLTFALESFLRVWNNNPTLKGIENSREELLSYFSILFLLPEKNEQAARRMVEVSILDTLRSTVKSYHRDESGGAHIHILEQKDEDVTFLIRLAKDLKISGPSIVRSILKATPKNRRESCVYMHWSKGTISSSETVQLIDEFGLRYTTGVD